MWFRDAWRISHWFLVHGHDVRPEKVLAGTDLLQVRSDRSLTASIFSINSFRFLMFSSWSFMTWYLSRSSDYSSWSSDIFSVFSQALDHFTISHFCWCVKHHIPDHACLGFLHEMSEELESLRSGTEVSFQDGPSHDWSTVNQSPPEELWGLTPMKTKIYPENQCLEDETSFQPAPLLGTC